ncbi:hypothetical protein BZG36_00429 [Bifiguratus adelaidae]|uniref:Uncharacterized protein n=1 Tax=Bifiguratus adelaidae TaxID=1938954 RepID=A0A261Y813_9FUNG|nr:hypothetical protein BZG36_00429 [Bifiguratus adelaidae]
MTSSPPYDEEKAPLIAHDDEKGVQDEIFDGATSTVEDPKRKALLQKICDSAVLQLMGQMLMSDIIMDNDEAKQFTKDNILWMMGGIIIAIPLCLRMANAKETRVSCLIWSTLTVSQSYALGAITSTYVPMLLLKAFLFGMCLIFAELTYILRDNLSWLAFL